MEDRALGSRSRLSFPSGFLLHGPRAIDGRQGQQKSVNTPNTKHPLQSAPTRPEPSPATRSQQAQSHWVRSRVPPLTLPNPIGSLLNWIGSEPNLDEEPSLLGSLSPVVAG